MILEIMISGKFNKKLKEYIFLKLEDEIDRTSFINFYSEIFEHFKPNDIEKSLLLYEKEMSKLERECVDFCIQVSKNPVEMNKQKLDFFVENEFDIERRTELITLSSFGQNLIKIFNVFLNKN